MYTVHVCILLKLGTQRNATSFHAWRHIYNFRSIQKIFFFKIQKNKSDVKRGKSCIVGFIKRVHIGLNYIQ